MFDNNICDLQYNYFSGYFELKQIGQANDCCDIFSGIYDTQIFFDFIAALKCTWKIIICLRLCCLKFKMD